MRIVVSCKIVPDDQDIQVAKDNTLNFAKAHPVVSEYDLSAIEFAACLAESTGSSIKAISVSDSSADNSKLKKSVLARGLDELFLVADDACKNLDSAATAKELSKLVDAAGGFDVLVVGAGSADNYSNQVGVHLAAELGAPYVPGVVKVAVDGDSLECERVLESQIEEVSVPLPCVISALPSAANPRIAGMKDILAAGKKPTTVCKAEGIADPAVSPIAFTAPERVDRKCEVFENVDEFIDAISNLF